MLNTQTINVTVSDNIEISDDEILRKLEEAEEYFKAGKYMSYEEFKERTEKHINEFAGRC